MNNNVSEENGKVQEKKPVVSPAAKESKEKKPPKQKKPVNKKRRKKIKKFLIIILVILAVVFFFAWKSGSLDKMFNKNTASANQLSTYSVSRRTIIEPLTSSGTIEANDSYTITALVNGEILNDYFEEGDVVEEDELLYQIDSKNLDSSVKKSQNSIKNAQRSLEDAKENLEKLSIKSDYEGTIEKIYVEVGDEVNAGTKIADIIDKDTMCIDVPFMSTDAANIHVGDKATLTFEYYETRTGTVSEISPTTSVSSLGVVTRNITIKIANTGSITTSTSAYAQIGNAVCTASSTFYYNDEGSVTAEIAGKVNTIYFDEGDKVNKNQLIVLLKSTSLENQIESLELSLDDAQSSLDDSLDAYDNYNITSPISGTVISKDFKAGDTIGGSSNSGSQLAVIYDMSALKFSMSIDELDIDKLSEGQDVVVTSDARTGKEYHGTITSISLQGTTTNGTTVYPVTVTIDNVEDEDQRITDEDGTIHKTFLTGRASEVKSYNLSSNDGNTYNYGDDISVRAETTDNGVTYYVGDKALKLIDGQYRLKYDTYTFSDGMNSLTIEKVDDTQMLRPGMNIDAKIIVAKSENTLAVPASAVGRGNKVKVLKNTTDTIDAKSDENEAENAEKPEMPSDGAMPEMPADGAMPSSDANSEKASSQNTDNSSANAQSAQDSSSGNRRGQNAEYGTAAADAEYEEITVTIGISDDDYVEITDGLSEGDVVILDDANLASNSTAMMGYMGGGYGDDYGGGYGGGPNGGGRPSGGPGM